MLYTRLLFINRFLCSSSSATIRRWSSTRVVPYCILATVSIVTLTYIHVPINSRLNAGPSCAFIPGVYNAIFGISNLFMFSMGPSITMIVFGLLTIRNLRGMMKRIEPKNNASRTQNTPRPPKKAADRQLIQMMILQCIFCIVTATPTSLYYFYSAAMSSVPMSALEKARMNLTSTILNFISVAGPCLSFYMFTLSSQLFRRELMNLIHFGIQTMPTNTTRSIEMQRRDNA